ncbi:MAG: zf-HC2 domain-containing protein [Acidobacteriota bacterium]|nr:zf-HC2 domain-containing protein [Acidobacteriota bacterium]
MNCLPDGLLRAKIDQELNENERRAAEEHLASCARCRDRLTRLERDAGLTARQLSALAPRTSSPTDPGEALARMRTRINADEAYEAPPRQSLAGFFGRHPAPAFGGAIIAVLVILLLTLAPVRSAAQHVLAMLRVQKVTVVPVDLPAAPSRDTIARIRQLFASRVTVTLSPGKPAEAQNASGASKLAGFPVRVLTGASGAEHISVLGEQAYVMTLDRERLQEILNDLGRSDLQIPQQTDGQTIAIHIPKAALLSYGDCVSHARDANPAPAQQRPPEAATGCIRLAEVPSPIVSVPPGLNIDQLAEIVLEATGMSAQEAASFCQTVNWKSTLVIPIPGNAASYQQEQVDGVEGTLIMGRPRDDQPGGFALIWVKNGIIYSIEGKGDPERALALAGTLS